jgi:hypothetical protein
VAAAVCTLVLSLVLLINRYKVGAVFTSNTAVIGMVARIMPLLAVYVVADGMQTAPSYEKRATKSAPIDLSRKPDLQVFGSEGAQAKTTVNIMQESESQLRIPMLSNEKPRVSRFHIDVDEPPEERPDTRMAKARAHNGSDLEIQTTPAPMNLGPKREKRVNGPTTLPSPSEANTDMAKLMTKSAKKRGRSNAKQVNPTPTPASDEPKQETVDV